MRLCLQSWRDKHHTRVPSLRDVLVSRVKSWRTCVRNRDNKTCRRTVVLECGSSGGIVERPCGTLACTVDTGTSLPSATVWEDYSTSGGLCSSEEILSLYYDIYCHTWIHTFIHTCMHTYVHTYIRVDIYILAQAFLTKWLHFIVRTVSSVIRITPLNTMLFSKCFTNWCTIKLFLK
jgi:hypothetical protein